MSKKSAAKIHFFGSLRRTFSKFGNPNNEQGRMPLEALADASCRSFAMVEKQTIVRLRLPAASLYF